MASSTEIIIGVWVILPEGFKADKPHWDRLYIKFSAASGFRTDNELLAIGKAVKMMPKEFRTQILGYKFNKTWRYQ